ncbi:MAG: winged helix-turn-helix transcriptional regulator [Rhizobiaceae bacterium]|nr:winged helix-turn-helix transcriptional regulator [Rhizobiaceae bacterium]
MRYPIDPDSFGFLVTDLTRLIRTEMDRLIAEAGLGITPGDARTLSHAARAGSIRQTLLAERIGVEAMTVSSSLDRLEAQGLIVRSADPADRRAKLVRVTEAGEAMLARIAPLAARLRAGAGQGVSAEEWQGFIGTLKTVRDNLTAVRESGRKVAAE